MYASIRCKGYFIALVVVGSRELTEAEFLMSQCSDYVQTVFKNTKTGNGQKWLMLDVRNREIMDDVFCLINLRKAYTVIAEKEKRCWAAPFPHSYYNIIKNEIVFPNKSRGR